MLGENTRYLIEVTAVRVVSRILRYLFELGDVKRMLGEM